MDDEQANYVIDHYSILLTIEEKAALKHYRSTLKLEETPDDASRKNMYYKAGWLSAHPKVLSLLDQGYSQFITNCATRILNDNYADVYFNLCPKCNKLARTPYAKQCRYCKHDWH
jgi:hypothetical protein